LCRSGVSLQKSLRDAIIFDLSAFNNVLAATVRQQIAEIGHDGTGVSLVKIENADLCWVDQDLPVVEIAVNKTRCAVLISGRLHVQGMTDFFDLLA
jgi:hypothetical protein